MPRKTLAQSDPRRAGGQYLSGYWHEEYTVTAIETRAGVLWLTCAWADGRSTTHCTAWDSRRDVILSQPPETS